MLMFMTNTLPLPIYDVEFHKDQFLDLCYFFCICLLFQHKDLERVKEELTKNFSNICDWFVVNSLSIYFGEDKTKSVLFSTKNKKRKIGTKDRIG